jgi:hypothetical protein
MMAKAMPAMPVKRLKPVRLTSAMAAASEMPQQMEAWRPMVPTSSEGLIS